MTLPDVKLCDVDFSSFHWEKDDVGPERFVVTIDGKSESHCTEIKTKTLENQDIRQRLENKIKENEDTQKSIKSKLDKMDDEQRENDIEIDIPTYNILEDTLDSLAVDHEELMSILNGESQK
jgi:hypothetical protein